jgi:hypothetical protein
MSRDKQRDEETEIKKDEKSDRLKRREHRQQIRDGQIASTNACVNLTNEMQVCPIPQKKTAYESRKTQKSGKDDDEIKKDGVDYDYDKISIRELFDDFGVAAKKESLFGEKKPRQSYIYIISKVIDGRTFFKIGYSDIASNAVVGVRLESHKTTLIPGLKNIGFKLHYLFFYDRLVYGGETSYAHLVEQELHKYLRKHKEYKAYIIHYPSSNPSEWYLPDEGKFREFMDHVLYFIGVQVPEPKQAYWFIKNKGKEKRLNKDAFFPETTPEDIYEFRHDFSAQMAQVKITQRIEKSQQQLKKGTLSHFKGSLLSSKASPPLGDDVKIEGVVFYSKATTSLLKSREYYVVLSALTLSFQQLNQFIPILGKAELVGRDDDDEEYVTHISHVLRKMNELKTLDMYELKSNFHFYDDAPIQNAKSSFMTTFHENVSIPKKDLNWMIGRYLKDANEKTYVVELLVTLSNNATKVDRVNCVEVDGKTLKPQTPKKTKIANVFTVIHLVVEYHDNKIPSLELGANYKEKMKHLNPANTKFAVHDLITIQKGYYVEQNTNTPIQKEFDGLITNIEMKQWKKGETPALCYDILFQDGSEWFHTTDSIDKKSKLKHGKGTTAYKTAQKTFLGRIKGPLQASAEYIMEVLGFKSPEKVPSRIRRSTRKKTTSNPGKKSTRSSTRKSRK